MGGVLKEHRGKEEGGWQGLRCDGPQAKRSRVAVVITDRLTEMRDNTAVHGADIVSPCCCHSCCHGDGSDLSSLSPTWSLERSGSRSRMGLSPLKPT